MMHMTFYWSKEVVLLVDTWHTRSWSAYSLSLLACFLAAVLYQYLEHSRLRLILTQPPRVVPSPSSNDAAATTPFLLKYAKNITRSSASGDSFLPKRCRRFAEGVLFGVNAAIGYMLMLVVMSFNGGVFVSVVVGLTVGYWAFRSGCDESSMIVDNPCACA